MCLIKQVKIDAEVIHNTIFLIESSQNNQFIRNSTVTSKKSEMAEIVGFLKRELRNRQAHLPPAKPVLASSSSSSSSNYSREFKKGPANSTEIIKSLIAADIPVRAVTTVKPLEKFPLNSTASYVSTPEHKKKSQLGCSASSGLGSPTTFLSKNRISVTTLFLSTLPGPAYNISKSESSRRSVSLGNK